MTTKKKEKAAARPVAKAAAEKEVIFTASLTVAQVLKQMVVANVIPTGGPAVMQDARLSFGRDLLPGDYDWSEDREYELVITRVK